MLVNKNDLPETICYTPNMHYCNKDIWLITQLLAPDGCARPDQIPGINCGIIAWVQIPGINCGIIAWVVTNSRSDGCSRSDQKSIVV